MAPEGDLNPQVYFEAINACYALSGAGSDGLRLSHLHTITKTQFGQEHLGASIGAFWKRIVDKSDALPPQVLRTYPVVQPHGPWGRMPPDFRAGMGWPCLTAAGTITACKRPPVRACASVGLS